MRALQRAGRRAHWVYEEERPHPVNGGYDFRKLATVEAFEAAYLARWRALLAWLRQESLTLVVESAFLQWPIITLLRANDPVDEIVALLDHSAAVVAPAVTVISTRVTDTRRAWHAVCDRRGSAWEIGHLARAEASPYAKARGLAGPAAIERYWQEHTEIAGGVIARMTSPSIVLDAAGTWSARHATIAAALGVAPVDPRVACEDPARFAGTYRGRPSGREARITAARHGLDLAGILWWRSPLLWIDGLRFEAEGWPFTFTFREDEGGGITGFTTSGPSMAWGRPDAEFDRVS